VSSRICLNQAPFPLDDELVSAEPQVTTAKL